LVARGLVTTADERVWPKDENESDLSLSKCIEVKNLKKLLCNLSSTATP